MRLTYSIKVDTRKLQALQGQLDDRASKVIRITAFHIEDDAKNAGPVDTGALVNSIYVMTEHENHYDEGVAGAKKKNAKAPIAAQAPTPKKLEAVIASAVEYAIYQEFGTTHMAAHPFLVPALEAEREPFMQAWEALLR